MREQALSKCSVEQLIDGLAHRDIEIRTLACLHQELSGDTENHYEGVWKQAFLARLLAAIAFYEEHMQEQQGKDEQK